MYHTVTYVIYACVHTYAHMYLCICMYCFGYGDWITALYADEGLYKCMQMYACMCVSCIYLYVSIREWAWVYGWYARVRCDIQPFSPMHPFRVVLQVDHIIGSSSKETEEWAWMIMIRSVICCQLTRLSSYSRYCIARSRYVHFPVNPKHILSNNNLSSLNRVILALFQVQNMFERTYSSPTLSTQSCTKPYACICVSLPSHMVLSFLYSWKYDN